MIHDYTDYSIETPGCHPGVTAFRIQFNLNDDVSGLFPYINASAEDAKYFQNPHYIQFSLKGKGCALYADKVLIRIFENREQAVGFFNTFKEFINDIESRKNIITPDNSFHEYIPVLTILKQLPKTNCGECGFPTCMAFASAVSQGDSHIDDCVKNADNG